MSRQAAQTHGEQLLTAPAARHCRYRRARLRDGALLVSEEANPSGELFYRPLDGHVEFGEHALDTVHREFRGDGTGTHHLIAPRDETGQRSH